jgi:hypothetical protein
MDFIRRRLVLATLAAPALAAPAVSLVVPAEAVPAFPDLEFSFSRSPEHGFRVLAYASTTLSNGEMYEFGVLFDEDTPSVQRSFDVLARNAFARAEQRLQRAALAP